MYHNPAEDIKDDTYAVQMVAGVGFVATLNNKGIVSVIDDRFNSITNAVVNTWTNIKKLYSTDRSLYGLKNDGTVYVAGPSGYTANVTTWTDIVDLCAEEFQYIVGIKNDETLVNLNDGTYAISSAKKVSTFYHDSFTKFEKLYLCDDNKVYNVDGGVEYAPSKEIIDISGGRNMGCIALFADGTASSNNSTLNSFLQNWFNLKKVYVPYARAVNSSTFYPAVVGLRNDGKVYFYGTSGVYGNYQQITDELATWSDIIDVSGKGNTIAGLKKDGTILYICADSDKRYFVNLKNLQPEHIFIKAPDYDCPAVTSSDGMILSGF